MPDEMVRDLTQKHLHAMHPVELKLVGRSVRLRQVCEPMVNERVSNCA